MDIDKDRHSDNSSLGKLDTKRKWGSYSTYTAGPAGFVLNFDFGIYLDHIFSILPEYLSILNDLRDR